MMMYNKKYVLDISSDADFILSPPYLLWQISPSRAASLTSRCVGISGLCLEVHRQACHRMQRIKW